MTAVSPETFFDFIRQRWIFFHQNFQSKKSKIKNNMGRLYIISLCRPHDFLAPMLDFLFYTCFIRQSGKNKRSQATIQWIFQIKTQCDQKKKTNNEKKARTNQTGKFVVNVQFAKRSVSLKNAPISDRGKVTNMGNGQKVWFKKCNCGKFWFTLERRQPVGVWQSDYIPSKKRAFLWRDIILL
jgi:hypothetical protein